MSSRTGKNRWKRLYAAIAVYLVAFGCLTTTAFAEGSLNKKELSSSLAVGSQNEGPSALETFSNKVGIDASQLSAVLGSAGEMNELKDFPGAVFCKVHNTYEYPGTGKTQLKYAQGAFAPLFSQD